MQNMCSRSNGRVGDLLCENERRGAAWLSRIALVGTRLVNLLGLTKSFVLCWCRTFVMWNTSLLSGVFAPVLLLGHYLPLLLLSVLRYGYY
jgi:hypothetical protein